MRPNTHPRNNFRVTYRKVHQKRPRVTIPTTPRRENHVTAADVLDVTVILHDPPFDLPEDEAVFDRFRINDTMIVKNRHAVTIPHRQCQLYGVDPGDTVDLDVDRKGIKVPDQPIETEMLIEMLTDFADSATEAHGHLDLLKESGMVYEPGDDQVPAYMPENVVAFSDYFTDREILGTLLDTPSPYDHGVRIGESRRGGVSDDQRPGARDANGGVTPDGDAGPD